MCISLRHRLATPSPPAKLSALMVATQLHQHPSRGALAGYKVVFVGLTTPHTLLRDIGTHTHHARTLDGQLLHLTRVTGAENHSGISEPLLAAHQASLRHHGV